MAHLPIKTEELGDKVKLTFFCIWCQKLNEITVDKEKWELFLQPNSPFVQDIWPEMSMADRETLISGSHDACFDAMFPEDEDDDVSSYPEPQGDQAARDIGY